MDLYDVMRTTFAAREFTGEPLPDRILYRILGNARFAPSGGNRQAVRIIVIRDQQTRDRLAELSVPGAQRYVAQLGIGEAPWNPLRPSSVRAADVDTAKVPDTLIAPLRRASVVLVVCLDLRYVAATDQDLRRVGVVSGPDACTFTMGDDRGTHTVQAGLRQPIEGDTTVTATSRTTSTSPTRCVWWPAASGAMRAPSS